jgi:hypothetical protein
LGLAFSWSCPSCLEVHFIQKILEAQEHAETECSHPSMVKSLDKQHTYVNAFVDEEIASGPSDDRHMEEEFEA